MTTPQQQTVQPASAPKPVAAPADGGVETKFSMDRVKAKLAMKGVGGARIFQRDEIYNGLTKHVVGQDGACRIIDTLYAVGAARQSSTTPIMTAVLGGPPGTGKSFVVETLHRLLTGESDVKSMVFVDCGKLTNPDTASTYLFGAPKGYVGAEDGGKIVRGLRDRPTSVILFDEFEKAHPKVQESLLVCLNSGFVDDLYTKEKVSCTRSAWFFTTNKNQQTIDPIVAPITDPRQRKTTIKQNYVSCGFLSPEFADRMDGFIWMAKLKDDNLLTMIANVIVGSVRRFDSRFSVVANGIADEAVILLYEELQSASEGARGLRRMVDETVQTDLLDMIRDGITSFQIRIVVRDGAVHAIPADPPTAT